MNNVLEYRIEESNLLLVVALHETHKRMGDPTTTAKDKEFYAEYITRLNAAITDNNKAVITAATLARPPNTDADFEYMETPEIVFLTPLSDSGLEWLTKTLPLVYKPMMGRACSMSRDLGADMTHKIAGAGFRVKAA